MEHYAAWIVTEEDKSKAIALFRKLIQSVPAGHPYLPSALDHFVYALLNRFGRTGDLADVSEAISTQQRALRLTRRSHPELSTRLNKLGSLYTSRFMHTGSLLDISESISAYQSAVQTMPRNHTLLSDILTNLGNSFSRRFEVTECLSDISEAISSHQKSLQLLPGGHPALNERLSNLATAFGNRFKKTGATSDINEAISLQQRAIRLTPDGHPHLLRMLGNLGTSLSRRFDRTGNLDNLSAAISAQQRAVRISPEGHPELPASLDGLGNVLTTRFERTGALSDISEAISLHQRAVRLSPPGHPDFSKRLSHLSTSFARRFEHTGNLSDSDEAISFQRRAIKHTPTGHRDLPTWYNNLGNSLMRRFDRTGSLSHIDDAISAHQQAVGLTPEGHSDLPIWLTNLGNSYSRRFRHTSAVYDLDKAIDAQKKAVGLTPESHGDLPALLNNLASSYGGRFQRARRLSDASRSISTQQRAIQLTPGDHADLPGRLTSLGNLFMGRYELTGDASDISEAIAVQQRAVSLTPEDRADLPTNLRNLSASFMRRFERGDALSDIIESVALQRRAIQLTSEGHADLSACLTNLGAALTRLYEKTKAVSDIDEAISVQRRAVQLTPEGHRGLSSTLSNLGSSLMRRFKLSKNDEDVVEGVSVLQRAVNLTPNGHADLPANLLNLGIALSDKAVSAARDPQDIVTGLSSLKSAATCAFGSPNTRLRAAKRWAQTLFLLDHNPHSLDIIEAFDIAIALIALMAGLDHTVRGRYTQLQGVSTFVLEAAAAALSRNRADKAVEWLEQGRCLVWSQLNNLRTPLDDLRAQDGALADEVADVSRRLEGAASSQKMDYGEMSLSEKISVEDGTRDHLDLAKRWDDVLSRVRSLPGFETFLLPSPYSTLVRDVPTVGYVIIVNVDKRRCDALVLRPAADGPVQIPLPQLTLQKVENHRAGMKADLERHMLRVRDDGGGLGDENAKRGVRAARPKGALSVAGVLQALWSELVKPIVDALKLSKIDALSGRTPPRIWWCPTGPLSFLPIHAAGIYGGKPEVSESISDYAISSYAPTITALTTRARNSCPIEMGVSGLLLTSQPRAPRFSSIPGTTTEVQAIHKKAVEHRVRVMKLEGDDVSAQECLEYMDKFSAIHLACHASQNAADPLASRFIFHKGFLELHSMIRKNLKHADLAFLSACQTSTGEEKLSDEAVHLAAGMLAAGYRRVVATMWSIGDKYAPDVANDFYGFLWSHEGEEGERGFDGSRSAEALHYAIQRLRGRLDNSDRSLLTWPFQLDETPIKLPIFNLIRFDGPELSLKTLLFLSTMSQNNLPPELWERIVQQDHGLSSHDLKQICLVSTFFTSLSQRILFQRVEIRPRMTLRGYTKGARVLKDNEPEWLLDSWKTNMACSIRSDRRLQLIGGHPTLSQAVEVCRVQVCDWECSPFSGRPIRSDNVTRPSVTRADGQLTWATYDALSSLLDTLKSTIPLFSRLRRLELSGCVVSQDLFDVLVAHPSLRELALEHKFSLPRDTLKCGQFLGLQVLRCDALSESDVDGIYGLISAAQQLRSFTLQDCGSRGVLAKLSKKFELERRSFPLRHLHLGSGMQRHISLSPEDLYRILCHTPALRELVIQPRLWANDVEAFSPPPDIVPRLEIIQADVKWVGSLAPGRPLRVIRTSEANLHDEKEQLAFSDTPSLHRAFGPLTLSSCSTITTLHLVAAMRYLAPIGVLSPYIADHFPGLQDLRIPVVLLGGRGGPEKPTGSVAIGVWGRPCFPRRKGRVVQPLRRDKPRHLGHETCPDGMVDALIGEIKKDVERELGGEGDSATWTGRRERIQGRGNLDGNDSSDESQVVDTGADGDIELDDVGKPVRDPATYKEALKYFVEGYLPLPSKLEILVLEPFIPDMEGFPKQLEGEDGRRFILGVSRDLGERWCPDLRYLDFDGRRETCWTKIGEVCRKFGGTWEVIDYH